METKSPESSSRRNEVMAQATFASAHKAPNPLVMPVPKPPSKCPLFCCFYAEFDNKVGPRVSSQSPLSFMDQEIQMPLERIHSILQETFDSLQKSSAEKSSYQPCPTGGKSGEHSESATSETDANAAASTTTSSGRDSGGSNPNADKEKTNIGSSVPDGFSSIFDSCSEYIITGSEQLSGKIVNLSTHHIHILTRPTIISNERYERNALLFCVGFVLRRTEDPRPFRPVLSKLADTLRDMEVESRFLSSSKKTGLLQRLLDWTLVSLNSTTWECNLYLDAANVLNLKLFHPPKPPALPVSDFAVPVFLRRDWQVQSFDWDLAINWVSLHIDGITNARQISKKAGVDMEMVLSCLRVLRHHGVIAVVDMFFFTNRYECTDKAALLLTGKESKLLHHAVEFVIRRPAAANSTASDGTNTNSYPISSSPSRFVEPVSQSSIFYTKESSSQQHEMHGSYKFSPVITSQIASQDMPMIHPLAHRRVEYGDVKVAVAELYSVCHRGTSIGDLVCTLISGVLPPGMPATVNWKKMLHLMDLRRFASFGQVHGLLRRVHDYPVLLDGDAVVRNDSETSNFSLLGTASQGRSNSYSRSDSTGDDPRSLRLRLSSLMNGRHCDDELVCTLERPYEDLLNLLPKDNVVHVFATESSVQ